MNYEAVFFGRPGFLFVVSSTVSLVAVVPSPPSGAGGLGFLGGRPRGLFGVGSPSWSVLGC